MPLDKITESINVRPHTVNELNYAKCHCVQGSEKNGPSGYGKIRIKRKKNQLEKFYRLARFYGEAIPYLVLSF